MATAAPAAAAPSAAPAAGSPGADAGALATPATSTTPTPSAVSTAEPVKARPIKSPSPRLPGVWDDDGFPPPPSPPSKAGSPAPDGERAPQARGADGRFLSAPSSDTPGSVPHTLQLGQPPTQDAAQPTPAKFKFAGEDFDSQEAAEQNFRSLRGTFKPLQALAKQVGGVGEIPQTLARAAESARGWKAAHDSLQAELHALRSGKQPSQPSPQSPTAPDASPTPTPEFDWELYAEVKKLATESGEPWKADQYLMEQMQKVERARYDRALQEALEPFHAQQANAQTHAQTEALFDSLSDYTNSDGSDAFPELSNESAAYEVGRIWSQLGLPKAFALSPQGAIAAIGIYRIIQQASQGSQATPVTVAPPIAQLALPPAPAPTDALSAAGLTDGKPTVASAPTGDGPSPEAARILAGMRNAHIASSRRATLGFDA